jgi:hypothetical protein
VMQVAVVERLRIAVGHRVAGLQRLSVEVAPYSLCWQPNARSAALPLAGLL